MNSINVSQVHISEQVEGSDFVDPQTVGQALDSDVILLFDLKQNKKMHLTTLATCYLSILSGGVME